MHRVKVIMTYGTPDYHNPGSLDACLRYVREHGGTLEFHCWKHGWVKGQRCAICYMEGLE